MAGVQRHAFPRLEWIECRHRFADLYNDAGRILHRRLRFRRESRLRCRHRCEDDEGLGGQFWGQLGRLQFRYHGTNPRQHGMDRGIIHVCCQCRLDHAVISELRGVRLWSRDRQRARQRFDRRCDHIGQFRHDHRARRNRSHRPAQSDDLPKQARSDVRIHRHRSINGVDLGHRCLHGRQLGGEGGGARRGTGGGRNQDGDDQYSRRARFLRGHHQQRHHLLVVGTLVGQLLVLRRFRCQRHRGQRAATQR